MRGAGFILFLLAATALGCQSAPPVPPDLGGLRVLVRAEPKQGYHPPARETHPMDGYAPPTAESWESGDSAYERVDYSNLDDIIVWVEPHEPAVDTSGTTSNGKVIIDVGAGGHRGHHGISAASVGSSVALANASRQPERVYLVCESGAVIDAGKIDAGGQGTATLRETGLVSVMKEGADEPLGQIYAAPSPWVKRAQSGTPVVFSGVTPGPCRVTCWHPRLPGSSTLAVLHPGRYTDVTLVVGVNGLPRVP